MQTHSRRRQSTAAQTSKQRFTACNPTVKTNTLAEPMPWLEAESGPRRERQERGRHRRRRIGNLSSRSSRACMGHASPIRSSCRRRRRRRARRRARDRRLYCDARWSILSALLL